MIRHLKKHNTTLHRCLCMWQTNCNTQHQLKQLIHIGQLLFIQSSKLAEKKQTAHRANHHHRHSYTYNKNYNCDEESHVCLVTKTVVRGGFDCKNANTSNDNNYNTHIILTFLKCIKIVGQLFANTDTPFISNFR